mgnify:FL=1
MKVMGSYMKEEVMGSYMKEECTLLTTSRSSARATRGSRAAGAQPGAGEAWGGCGCRMSSTSRCDACAQTPDVKIKRQPRRQKSTSTARARPGRRPAEGGHGGPCRRRAPPPGRSSRASPPFPAEGRTRRVRLVRGKDETCPLSTGGRTRRVHLVQGGRACPGARTPAVGTRRHP